MIEFRHLNHLWKIILSHSVAPHEPRGLCALSPSVMVYVDHTEARCRLHWLDCDEPKPKSGVLVRNMTHVGEADSLLCCVRDGETRLLIFGSQDGIFAYNLETEKVRWKQPGLEKLMDVRGVITDGRGRLYVCDFTNYAIQMFSVSDGQYLGCLIKAGDQDLWRPWRVEWCETRSSLIVVQDTGWKWIISTIHLEF